jgi:hypothetical protein
MHVADFWGGRRKLPVHVVNSRKISENGENIPDIAS